jgi:predicted transcriptional regulator
MQEVLAIVRRKKECTVPDIHEALGSDITTNGVNNRIADCLKAGLVTRRRSGKFFLYSIAK